MSETIETIEELFAHVQVMEREAYDCYLDLAEQMEVHNNREVAELFNKLAQDEKNHLTYVKERVGDTKIPHIAPWDLKNFEESGLSLTGAREVHYMMTPYHALKLALRAEQKTVAFFAGVVASSKNQEVCGVAAEFEKEEQHHIELINEWLDKVPRPEEDWDEDPDPPVQPT